MTSGTDRAEKIISSWSVLYDARREFLKSYRTVWDVPVRDGQKDVMLQELFPKARVLEIGSSDRKYEGFLKDSSPGLRAGRHAVRHENNPAAVAYVPAPGFRLGLKHSETAPYRQYVLSKRKVTYVDNPAVRPSLPRSPFRPANADISTVKWCMPAHRHPVQPSVFGAWPQENPTWESNKKNLGLEKRRREARYRDPIARGRQQFAHFPLVCRVKVADRKLAHPKVLR
jgi:hypothetical protein